MNTPKLIRSLLIVSAFVFSGITKGQISLDDCHEKARKNYPLIQQFDLIEQSKEYTLSNANKAYLPQLSVSVIGGIIEGAPSFSAPGETASSDNMHLITVLQFNQVIWDGGMTKSAKDIAEAGAKIEHADVEVNLYAIKERINNLFFGILLIEEQLEQMEFVKGNLNKNMDIVSAAFNNGAAFQSDIDEIKVEILNLDQQITEMNFNRAAFIEMLSLLIGEPIEENTAFASPLISDDVTSLEIQRPELNLFTSQEEMIESQLKMERTNIFPKLGLMGFGTFIQPGIAFGADEMSQILVAGLSLSWEFGSIYKRGNNKKLAEVNRGKINNRRETFLFSTNLELTRVEQEIEKYESLMERDEQLVKLKSNIKDTYQSKYENGVTSMPELLIRINEENQAKQNFIVHEIQYLMAVYEYKTTSGN